ncbi:MAG TPA: excalibur calcium-binding domain-containing protein, partial [Acidimicrobiales bacterium]
MSSASDSLPLHLATRPKPKGLARIGVGTMPFNLIAAALLLGISSFVVLGSDYSPGTDLDTNALPAPEQPPDLLPPGAVGARVTSEPTSTTTTSTTSTTTTTAAPPSTTTNGPGIRAVRNTEEPVDLPAAPPPPPPVTCDRFATQPEAQAVFDEDPQQHVGMDGDGDGTACEHLPGRPEPPPAEPVYIIPTKDELLRPPTRLFGVHTREAPFAMHEVEAFTQAVGKAPNNVMFFTNFSRGFPEQAVNNAWGAGMLPIVTFEPIVEDSDEGQPLLRDITNGEWDDYFREWAAAAKANGKPIGFRFAQEMNGNWYSWSDG